MGEEKYVIVVELDRRRLLGDDAIRLRRVSRSDALFADAGARLHANV